MCAGGPEWAYLVESDSNFKVYVAALIAARTTGASVTIYSQTVNGKCHIGHVAF
jgi:hypothetical protein